MNASLNGTGHTKAAIDFGEERPHALPVDPLGIAEALKARPQWVGWKYVRREGKDGRRKWTKIPIDVKTGRLAKSTDPTTWADFPTAWAYFCDHDTLDGIGYVFSTDDPFAGVDLDDCVDPQSGELLPWARAVVDELGSYSETSPSGTGVKVFCQGKPPDGLRCRKGAVEVYSQGRYFALTGKRLDGTPADVEARQQALESVCRRLLGAEKKGKPKADAGGGINLDDEAILAKARAAKNGAKFSALWSGDLGDHGSQSEADISLCCLLAFWTRGDGARVDRLFRQSGLMRSQWDEKRGEKTYGQRTVAEALRLATVYYEPGKQEADADAQTAAAPGGAQTGCDVILAYFWKSYQPTFRRGVNAYSAKLGREVKAGEATWAPPKALLDLLAVASDAPRDKGGNLKRSVLPYFFATWSKSAWVDMLSALPDEEKAEELSADAEEQFRQQVSGGLHQLVTLGEPTHKQGADAVRPERRALIDWCVRFARAGPFRSIRSYRIWTRLAADPGGGTRVEVALRVEVFEQLNYRPLVGLTQTKFARLCEGYRVGDAGGKAHGQRVVVLSQEFLAAILTDPNAAEAPTAEGGQAT